MLLCIWLSLCLGDDCRLKLPSSLNSPCISRSEPVSSSFKVRVRQDEVLLKCKYCEKEFEHHAVMQGI